MAFRRCSQKRRSLLPPCVPLFYKVGVDRTFAGQPLPQGGVLRFENGGSNRVPIRFRIDPLGTLFGVLRERAGELGRGDRIAAVIMARGANFPRFYGTIDRRFAFAESPRRL